MRLVRLRGRIRLWCSGDRAEHTARRLADWFGERHFAFAAVAAPPALFAEVIVAGVFGAPRANPRRFLSTDAALKWHGYFFFPVLAVAAGAVGLRIPRQRCASLSITTSARSRSAARLT